MKKTLSRVGILLATAMLMLGVFAGTAFAQDTYTPINGNNTSVTLNKSLNLHDSKYSPTHTATFTTTYVGNQLNGATQDATGVPPVITLSFDTTGAAQTAKVDFTGVSFPAPGIYRFQTAETAISDPAVTPVAGSEASYFVDVYVTNITTDTGASALQIDQYIIQKGSETPTVLPADVDNAKVTSADFFNEYTSYKLDVAKNVTGNQGDKTKEFTVTVTFSDGQAGDKYAVRWVAGTPKVNGTAIVNGTPVEIAANATVTLTLKDTDQVQFYGIPSGVKYIVDEDDYRADGYTTTGEVTTATALTTDTNVTVVDAKSGTIPTGIFLNYKPFWIMAALTLVLAVVVLRKRNNRFADEF